MKRLNATFLTITLVLAIAFTSSALAQVGNNLQYYRTPGKAGLNVFETPKMNNVPFKGMHLKIGGDLALQFQGLSQSNDADDLVELANNFNLPTANMSMDLQIEDGLMMHIRTFLSARHHREAWVKGGFLQVDKLDFISEGFLESFMEVARFRFGMDQINYGDTQFRRSDNAMTIYNPFVGNYIMDSYTTEPYAELTIMKDGFLGVVGLTNGRLNQSPRPGDDGISFYAKAGIDKQVNEDTRVRLTGSIYKSPEESTRDYLYGGDRAGARYYDILRTEDRSSDFDPRFNPGFAYQTAFQVNPFVKFKGLEFFGVFEVASNGADEGGSYTQTGAELLYRFAGEKLYVGGRYNMVSGEASDDAETREISRINIGGGWFLTDNVLTKIEHVSSSYDGAGFADSFYEGAEFNGFVIEAVISF